MMVHNKTRIGNDNRNVMMKFVRLKLDE